MFSCGGLPYLWRSSVTDFSTTVLYTGPTRPNRADLELYWCRFPTLASNRHTGLYRAEFEISLQKRVYPSPYRGVGSRLS